MTPKGMKRQRHNTTVGSPAGLSHIYADPDVMRRRVWTVATRLGVEPDRLLRWCFAQAVLAAVWSVEDGLRDIEPALEVAKVSRALLQTSSIVT